MRARMHSFRQVFLRVAIPAALLVLAASPAAWAQLSSGFEDPPYMGDIVGVDLNGQDGFYNPVPASSVSCLVYDYVANPLGLPVNPTGGDQFVAGTGPAGAFFARSQKDVAYGGGTGTWTTSFDIAITFTGVLPTTQNVGSFSTQLFPNEATFIALARWTDPVTAASWSADYVWFDAAGTQLIESVADPAFQMLLIDHWYRWSTTFDLATNLITEVSITDLTTGVTVTNNPVDKYLWGGSAGAPPPSGFRFFGGSSTVAGNTMAFDNLDIEMVAQPADQFVRGDINQDGTLDIADAITGLGILFSMGTPSTCPDSTDANDDGAFDISDNIYLLTNLFSMGPPPGSPFPGCGPDPTTMGDPLDCPLHLACP